LNISKIFHISDVHIRLYKRHKEYDQVFKRLYQYINDNKDENSIIFLGGDIVHNKTDMSPELVDVTARFFKSCADILPTILIAGNHDLNLNSVRLDALTPIVNSLNHPNLQYWKDSGVYRFGGVAFSVFGIMDSSDKWVYAKDIKAKYKIAVHHGPIIGAKTDNTIIETGNKVDIFDGFEISMLGDIHKFSYLNTEKTIGYSSSLLGQNYGEHVDEHGILVWDLKTRAAEFVKIKNDYGFFTFNLIDGKCEIPSNLPKNLRTRIKYENSTAEELEQFIQRLSKKYNIIELLKQKSVSIETTLQTNEDLLGNSRDVEFQNNIIRDLLKSTNTDITESEIQSVLDLNLEMNKLLPISSASRNVIWKPLKMEFSNMFSYGEDNVFDFSNMDGTYGIFSKNAEGKSSLFSILTFVLYDKTPVAIKAIHILNNQKSNFYCKLSFDLSGKIFFIERIGTKTARTGAVKVDVNFWTLDDDGEKVNLNGEDRDKTNFAIRDYVGTYDDFVMTSLSTQYDNQNFVEKSQRDRKELLYKFLDIFVYDELYRIAKENSKDYQVLIREFEKENLHQKSSHVYNQIQEKEIVLNEKESELFEAKGSLKEKNSRLIQLNKQYQPVKEGLDIDKIELEINACTDSLETSYANVITVQTNKNELLGKKQELVEQSKPFSVYGNLSEHLQDFQENESRVRDEENKIKLLDSELTECKVKQSHLQEHEYDPHCKFCTNNQFVISAHEAIEKIPELEQLRTTLIGWLHIYMTGLESSKQNVQLAKEYQNLTKQISDVENQVRIFEQNEQTLSFKIETFKSRQTELNKSKQEYQENASIIEANKLIIAELDEIKIEVSKLEQLESKLNQKHRSLEIEITQFKKEYSDCNEKLDKYLEYIKKYRVYELYLQAVSRDGVPYKIVEMVLPVLENEVNLILNSIATFTVRLEANDEKYIHAFIQYGDNNSWPVELSSGMERFILSLAFRVALTEITALPKSNFLAIDEGFGVLDAENVLQIGKLFEYLKTQYDHLICISHIDTMRDLVNKQIKIEKINGFSKVNYCAAN